MLSKVFKSEAAPDLTFPFLKVILKKLVDKQSRHCTCAIIGTQQIPETTYISDHKGLVMT